MTSIPESFTMMKCRRCGSKVLRATAAQKLDLPRTAFPAASHDGIFKSDENAAAFWLVADMYKFENIGFLKTVENCKFMTCAGFGTSTRCETLRLIAFRL
jgi:hypothetical protein